MTDKESGKIHDKMKDLEYVNQKDAVTDKITHTY